jgi:hypothetical protein
MVTSLHKKSVVNGPIVNSLYEPKQGVSVGVTVGVGVEVGI